ncbi:PREDICTED: zona pellucida sperm-binding protein 4 [Myotis brandtii]|uniref:zona pellucida sperm-binding protein 4 n=1 Tax=Myotis brandtii TaxID=109478 RepID=UPI0003BBA10B|nr:PREDICTED: zona pellucida sperm-binding protein 4 [Myotis brandtii]
MWLCPLLLCLPLSLALSGQREPEAPEDVGELHCGPEGLQFTVHPLGQASGTPPTLIAWGLDALGAHLCDSVPVGDRLPCAPAPATPRACKALGCCYNPSSRSCYYGNTGEAAALQAAEGSAHYLQLSLGEGKPLPPLTPQVTGDQAVYENELVAAQDVRTWSRGSITRDSTFRLRVSCTYPVSSSALPVNVQVSLLPPPLPETQPGALTLELQLAKDGNYSAYYRAGDYPVVKLLRDPIYVEVALRHRTDPDLGLLLHQCWATPGPDPGLQPQWALLVNGCPYAGDNYRTQLIPVPETESLRFPSHAQRFSIFTFSFVDAGAGRVLGGPVFLHCSVSVCQPAGSPSCVACPVTRRRRSSDAHDPNSTAFISSQGPMILLQATEGPSGKLPKYSRTLWVAGLSGTVVVGVLGLTYLAVKKWS